MEKFKHLPLDEHLSTGETLEHWSSDTMPYNLGIFRMGEKIVGFNAVPKKNETQLIYFLHGWKADGGRWRISIDHNCDPYNELLRMMISGIPDEMETAIKASRIAADAIEAIYDQFFSGAILPTDGLDKRYAYIYAKGGHPIRISAQLPAKKKDQVACALDPADLDYSADIAKTMWWASANLAGGTFDPKLASHHGGELPDPKFFELHQRLLSFGGYETCFPVIEEDMEKILARGQFWFGDHSKLMKGRDNACHANTCNLWEANRNEHEVAIATGYALSKDGVWRQHSWLLQRCARSVQIIETTCKRVAYFGFVMTEEEAESFSADNF